MAKDNLLEKLIEIKKEIETIKTVIDLLEMNLMYSNEEKTLAVNVNSREYRINLGDFGPFLTLLKTRMDNLKLVMIEIYNEIDLENNIDEYFK